MHDFDYYTEANKLTGFAQRCIEDYPKKDESFKRMQLELKSRREFQKNLETSKLLQSNRYDLVDDCVIEEYLTDYSKLAGIFDKVDPNSFKIEYNSPGVISRRKKNLKTPSSASKRSRLLENKKELLKGAEQNTSLVRTLLGGMQYIDPMHSSQLAPPLPPPSLPPPPPPAPPSVPTLSTTIPPASLYDPQSQVSLGNGLPLSHRTYPPVDSTAYSFPAYQQQPLLTPQQSMPPAPHMTSTLSPPRELRRERTVSQVSKSRKLSRKLPKRKMPKSLRRIGNIVEKYDLNM